MDLASHKILQRRLPIALSLPGSIDSGK